MTARCCVLVELDAEMGARAARDHLFELRDRLGDGALVDVRWRGDPLADLPPGVRVLDRGSGARALASAVTRAAQAGPLLVLLGPVLPDAAVVDALLGALQLDPLVGFAQPRFGDAAGDGVWSLPDGATAPELRSRTMLGVIPERYLTTERLCACLAVRREVAAGFTTSPDAPEDLRAALALELCQARRRGFRNLVLNRVVVSTALPHEALYPALGLAAREAMSARFTDAPRAEAWFNGAAHHGLERVASKVRRARPASPLPVLLDCRGAQAQHNGTSEAILGVLGGLAAEPPRWRIDLLCDAAAVEYHDLARRFEDWEIFTAPPDRAYAVAVRLDQPWHMSTLTELHRRAAAIVFHMHDTIAWDIVYPCEPFVEKVWRFTAAHADGLLYNSEFTRQRFRFRFPVADRVAEAVTHLSLDPADYRDEAAAALPQDQHVLVFGNYYDHKAVGPTVELLTRAFPYGRIEALGGAAEQRPNVTIQRSGRLPAAEIERLVATARLVVFPSWYEGFGLPVLKALAYGRTVLVRDSPLWRELAALTRTPGRLVPFSAPHELVELAGMALAGEPLDGLRLGADLGDHAPPGWRECARRTVALVEEVAGRWCGSAWLAREHLLEPGAE